MVQSGATSIEAKKKSMAKLLSDFLLWLPLHVRLQFFLGHLPLESCLSMVSVVYDNTKLPVEWMARRGLCVCAAIVLINVLVNLKTVIRLSLIAGHSYLYELVSIEKKLLNRFDAGQQMGRVGVTPYG